MRKERRAVSECLNRICKVMCPHAIHQQRRRTRNRRRSARRHVLIPGHAPLSCRFVDGQNAQALCLAPHLKDATCHPALGIHAWSQASPAYAASGASSSLHRLCGPARPEPASLACLCLSVHLRIGWHRLPGIRAKRIRKDQKADHLLPPPQWQPRTKGRCCLLAAPSQLPGRHQLKASLLFCSAPCAQQGRALSCWDMHGFLYRYHFLSLIVIVLIAFITVRDMPETSNSYGPQPSAAGWR